MSTSVKRLSLSNPLVIAVVLVLLALVVVVNIRTFGPRRTAVRRNAEPAAEYSAVPLDLEQVVRRAATAGLDGGAAGGALAAPVLDRDPFARRQAVNGTVAARGEPTSAGRVNPDSLICAAVMLGGRNPVARINGRTVKIGDRIRSCRVSGIGTEGVRLRHDDGREIFLAVSSGRESNKSYRMVSGLQDQEDPGRTSLDKDVPERQDP